jgi:protein-S-isoprenylcysteine O-methyltransferase Ste14
MAQTLSHVNPRELTIDAPPISHRWQRSARKRRSLFADIPDVLSRVVVSGLFLGLAVRLGDDYVKTGHVTGLLLVVSEGLVVLLTIIRRTAVDVDRSWEARLVTALSLTGPPLVRPAVALGLVPDVFTAFVSAIGLIGVLAGKLALGRSFGLVPANRGVVCSGVYRFLRHPIYTGYLLSHVAFFMANPTGWNFLVLGLGDAALMIRAVIEERTLRRDPEYASYMTRVRWRMIPSLF